MKGFVAIALAAILGLGGAWLGLWAYKTHTITQPFDEMWISTNASMPTPLRHWSCDTVKARIGGRTIPPHGCQDRW